MDARGLLRGGVGLTLAALVLVLASAVVETGGNSVLRPLAGLASVLGLLALVLAVYALAAPRVTPPLVAAGAALFVLGRLLSVGLSFLPGGSLGELAGIVFTALSVMSALGTALLFVGVFRVLQSRLEAAPRASAPSPAPHATAAPPRPRAIRPPQGPPPAPPAPPAKR
jgi:hypothetical protein